jgi:methionyl-tRNA formyltransferase
LKSNSIPIITLDEPINESKSVNKIKSFQPDLLISILGNQIFKSPIINLAPKGCINLHTSLLPKYRGLMPSFWVLKNNEIKTGVSVFFVDEGIDSGPIIVQTEIKINNKTQEELINYSKKIGMEAIAKSVDLIQKNQLNLIKNNHLKKTYFSFPTKEDVLEFKKIGKKFF